MASNAVIAGADARKTLPVVAPPDCATELAAWVDISRRWAERGGQTVLTQLLGQDCIPQPWAHHPPQDAHDPGSGFRWYYHCHPGGGRSPGEHGHFHLFSDRPDVVAESAAVTHLIAISVNPLGLPCGVFAPNGWVTDEHPWPASVVLRRLRAFALQRPVRLRPVHEWLRRTLGAFAPQVRATLKMRDLRLRQLSRSRPRPKVLEDRRIAVLSRCAVDVAAQARWCDAGRRRS